jgi:hypothetical protein
MELYSDLLTIYEVYVPTAIKQKVEGDLYVFARFFNIRTAKELGEFAEELGENTLAKQLAAGYTEVFNMGRYATITNLEEEAFWLKSDEEIYSEGKLEGQKAIAFEMLADELPIEQISKYTKLSKDEIESLRG